MFLPSNFFLLLTSLIVPILLRFNDEETVTEVSIHFFPLLDFTFKIIKKIEAYVLNLIPLKKYGGGSYFPSGAPGREERREEDFPQGENRKEKVPPEGGTDGYPGNCGLVATVVFELLLFHHPPMLTQKRLFTFRSDRGQLGRLGPFRQGGAH